MTVQGTRDRTPPPIFEDVDGVPTATIDVARPPTLADVGMPEDSSFRVVGSGLSTDYLVLLELDGTTLELPATDVSFGADGAVAADDPVDVVYVVDRVPYEDAVARWRTDVDRFGADPQELADWEAEVAALPARGGSVVEEGYQVAQPGAALIVSYRTESERDTVTVTHQVSWGER